MLPILSICKQRGDKRNEPTGILVLNKPSGQTSHDCVVRVRRLFKTKKGWSYRNVGSRRNRSIANMPRPRDKSG